jgi:F-type H+-transporting ATPase subunit epsilon
MDAHEFHLEIISPEDRLYKGEVRFALMPGSEGEFTILAHHAPFISRLKSGILKVLTASAEEYFAIDAGFAEISDSNVTAIVSNGCNGRTIDVAATQGKIGLLRLEAAPGSPGAADRNKKQLAFLESCLKAAALAGGHAAHSESRGA